MDVHSLLGLLSVSFQRRSDGRCLERLSGTLELNSCTSPSPRGTVQILVSLVFRADT